MPSGVGALSTLLEMQAAAGLLSSMGTANELSLDEQAELIRARFARIELAVLAAEDDDDGVEDDEDALADEELLSARAPTPVLP